jgi:hypothetical protein
MVKIWTYFSKNSKSEQSRHSIEAYFSFSWNKFLKNSQKKDQIPILVGIWSFFQNNILQVLFKTKQSFDSYRNYDVYAHCTTIKDFKSSKNIRINHFKKVTPCKVVLSWKGIFEDELQAQIVSQHACTITEEKEYVSKFEIIKTQSNPDF